MPDFVIVEIDIAADGSIVAEPNPVEVASGQTLLFHINSNKSEASKFRAQFPAGDDSPFEQTGNADITAKYCRGVASKVEWPEGVKGASVKVSVHGSPVLGELIVDVLQAFVDDEYFDGEPHVSHHLDHVPPQIVHNYYFDHATGGHNLHEVKDADWECSYRWVSIANTTRCYRYKVTNHGPSTVTVKASPSGKTTKIKAGSKAYVECSKIEVRTSSGHAHGDIDSA